MPFCSGRQISLVLRSAGEPRTAVRPPQPAQEALLAPSSAPSTKAHRLARLPRWGAGL